MKSLSNLARFVQTIKITKAICVGGRLAYLQEAIPGKQRKSPLRTNFLGHSYRPPSLKHRVIVWRVSEPPGVWRQGCQDWSSPSRRQAG
ncbi:hypothetical protein TNCV_2742451 [Trichonephila clavipes]|nr:hypothetical protein TNCV_2742451 [Trichonephila clavipes]